MVLILKIGFHKNRKNLRTFYLWEKQRKILGEKLSPVVKEYIDNEKSIDNNFFEIAKESMIHL